MNSQNCPVNNNSSVESYLFEKTLNANRYTFDYFFFALNIITLFSFHLIHANVITIYYIKIANLASKEPFAQIFTSFGISVHWEKYDKRIFTSYFFHRKGDFSTRAALLPLIPEMTQQWRVEYLRETDEMSSFEYPRSITRTSLGNFNAHTRVDLYPVAGEAWKITFYEPFAHSYWKEAEEHSNFVRSLFARVFRK